MTKCNEKCSSCPTKNFSECNNFDLVEKWVFSRVEMEDVLRIKRGISE